MNHHLICPVWHPLIFIWICSSPVVQGEPWFRRPRGRAHTRRYRVLPEGGQQRHASLRDRRWKRPGRPQRHPGGNQRGQQGGHLQRPAHPEVEHPGPGLLHHRRRAGWVEREHSLCTSSLVIISFLSFNNATDFSHRPDNEAEAASCGEDVQGADRELLQRGGHSDHPRQPAAFQIKLRPCLVVQCFDGLKFRFWFCHGLLFWQARAKKPLEKKKREKKKAL